jgi:hypothetical protein
MERTATPLNQRSKLSALTRFRITEESRSQRRAFGLVWAGSCSFLSEESVSVGNRREEFKAMESFRGRIRIETAAFPPQEETSLAGVFYFPERPENP